MPFRNLLSFIAIAVTIGLIVSAWAEPTKKAAAPSSGAGLVLMPLSSTIDGSYGYQTLSAVANNPDGSALDVTAQASLSSSNPGVVKIQNGVAVPVGDGSAEVVASYGGHSARAKITVKNSKTEADMSFANDITPILIKGGCIGAACHGAANGQGGFKLSFFGYEPDKDREAIWKANNGRRVNTGDPALSLIAMKPAMGVPHQGGTRFPKGGPEFKTLVAWVKAGGPVTAKSAGSPAKAASGGVKLASLETKAPAGNVGRILDHVTVWPENRVVKAPESTHQLIVTAHYADGSTQDVTPIARYFSDDDGIAGVTQRGVVKATRDGEANVMIRYNGKATVANFLMLTKPRPATYPKVPENNLVDTHVFAKLKKMGIIPSPLTSDYAFIRRVSLDIAGVLPTPNRIRDFVADKDPGKRAKLIDELLERPEYQDMMTIAWCDLLRVNRNILKDEGVREYSAFIRDSFADNKPFDQFVRELLSSGSYTQDAVDRSRDIKDRKRNAIFYQSSNYHNGPVNYYRVTNDPVELTTSTSQIFLGVRLDCTRCHNHPFDRWTMNDFYSFAAYFSGTGFTGGLVQDEVAVFTTPSAEMRNPRTNEVRYPKPLTEREMMGTTPANRKQLIAEWITSPQNPFFAKATVNRFWKHFFGRGIVHPVDDFRATNPPVNEPLLDALAKDFIDSKFDIKHVIRTICNSRTYQLSNESNETNQRDTKNFSHYYSKRLGPEVLFDAITAATNVPESFGFTRMEKDKNGNDIRVPLDKQAKNLPDNNVGSFFLDVFGRSRRLNVEERSDMASMAQALQLMNGPAVNDRISNPNGTIARILKSELKPMEAVEEIYLATLNRLPKDKERKAAQLYFEQSTSPKEAYEDLMWAIINSREFIFNH